MPSRSIRWPPVILISGTSWRSATSAIRRSSSAVVTPPRMRGTTRERAVVLDVRVDAVVDEARVALLAVAVAADLAHQVGEAGLAGAAVAAGAAGGAQLADRFEAALADHRGQLLARLAPAGAEERGLLGGAAALDREQLADERLARAAAGAGAGDVDDLERGAEAAGADGVDDLALADAVAVAHAGAVGEVGGGGLARLGEQRERVGRLAAGADRVGEQLGAADVAEQDRADGPAVARRRSACGSCARRRRRPRARRRATPARHEVDAHHLELRRGDRAGVGGVAVGRVARRPWPARGSARRCRARSPRCCAHSPTARTLGSRGRQRVVDDDPALDVQAHGAARAPSAAGCRREMTTRSASRNRRRRGRRRAG